MFQRHKLGPNLTPVTPESFAKWKQTRMNKKEAEQEALRKTKDAQNAAGKSSGMSGRDLVCYTPLSCNCQLTELSSPVPIQP
jgi:DRG Family Regulatory Proteins, Tma46